MKKLTFLLLFLISHFFLLFLQKPTTAQSLQVKSQETLQGKVTDVGEKRELTSGAIVQNVTVLITKGSLKGQHLPIEAEINETTQITYQIGDDVEVLKVDDESEQSQFFITDHVRRNDLLLLFLIFGTVVLTVSRMWGLASLFGMAYSFLIIFKFILPNILSGHNPLWVAIFGAFFISPVTFYLSHGLNKKTTIALVSTFISLLITGILATIFIQKTKLTGFGSEEAYFLQLARGQIINMQGILLAGIIIGTLGILDDVTISQSAIVGQLKRANEKMTKWELYKKAMTIGHDHIASTVNTLILVYAGAALPLLLLFTHANQSFLQAINNQMIAEEIVRTLVGSIGLVLAVPIATVLAVFSADSKEQDFYHTH